MTPYGRFLAASAFLAWHIFAVIPTPAGIEVQSDFLCEAWTKERGLPDNSIRAITQTEDGYIWIGTRAGLVRFDGARFTTFGRANCPEMPSDDCLSLAPDGNAIWLGTRRGLLRRSAQGFSSWLTNETGRCSEINAVHVSPTSGIWVGGYCAIYQLPDRQRLERRLAGGDFEYIGAIREDSSGSLWLGSRFGLWRYHPSRPQPPEKIFPEDRWRGQAFLFVDDIKMAGDGTIWTVFGQAHETVRHAVVHHWVYGYRGEQWTRPGVNPIMNSGRPCFVGLDRASGMWFPNGTNGLVRYRDGAALPVPFSAAQPADYATCFFCDREGNVWIGTENSGLIQYRPRQIGTITTKDGLPHENTWALCASRDGSVWAGTDGGVARWQRGAMTSFDISDGLARNTIRSICEDRSGTIWAGTGHGLNFFGDERWHRFPLPGELSGNKIRVLYPDDSGSIWVGTLAGLARIRQGQVESLPHLAGVDVRALLQDRSGRLWIGTHGQGLFCREGESVTNFSVANGLASDLVWALHEDAQGTLWFGGDRGLQRYANGTFSIFTRHQGLFDDGVNHILEDDFGNLWVSCDRGIYRVSKRQLEEVASGRRATVSCVSYGAADGLLSIETNGQKSQPAGCKTADGRLWFPTTKGVAVFDPANLPDNRGAPQPAIEHIRADGQTIFRDGPRAVDPVQLPERERARSQTFSTLGYELRLAPGSAHVLEIQYTANTFVDAERVRYKYRLDGLDRDWIDAGYRRIAQYANLKPGKYRFRVMAVSKYGVESEGPASFAFHLQPHYYQTRVFYALGGGVLLAGVLGVYRWRLGYVRRIHQLEQQRAVADDRARIARDLHDGLGAQLTNLSLLAAASEARAAAVDGHETRFRELSRIARETALQLREIIWANHPGDDTLEGLASRVCDYAQQWLRAAEIRCRFEIAPDLPADPLSVQARHHLYLTAKESLHNTLKHASATEVRICFRVSREELEMVIEDNGAGFTSAPENGPAKPLNGGCGLQNMRRRIETLKGILALTSKPGCGVRLQINVPLRNLFSGVEQGKVAAHPKEPNDHASLHRRG